MKNYSLATLEKMLIKAEEKYYNETIKPKGNWGDGMRLSKLPTLASWDKAKVRVELLKKAIALKKQGLSIEKL